MDDVCVDRARVDGEQCVVSGWLTWLSSWRRGLSRIWTTCDSTWFALKHIMFDDRSRRDRILLRITMSYSILGVFWDAHEWCLASVHYPVCWYLTYKMQSEASRWVTAAACCTCAGRAARWPHGVPMNVHHGLHFLAELPYSWWYQQRFLARFVRGLEWLRDWDGFA